MVELMRLQRASAVAVIAVLFTATSGYTQSGRPSEMKSGYANASLLISGRELSERLTEPGIRILDVRSAEKYTVGHTLAAGNIHIGAMTTSLNEVPGMLAPVDVIERVLGEHGVTDKTRVIVYDDVGGPVATRLFWALEYLGHPQVSVLQGGFGLWQKEKRLESREIAKAAAARFMANPRAERLADKQWVQNHLKDPSVVLVDARSAEEFTGKVGGPGVKRPGHIPGAVNVNWVLNLTEAEPREFKPSARLAELYGQAGATQQKEILVYCHTGARASNASERSCASVSILCRSSGSSISCCMAALPCCARPR